MERGTEPPEPRPPAAPAVPAPPLAATGALAVELTLPEAAARRLWRQPALSGRAGRPRGAPEALVWLDGADAPLFEAGLLLERPVRGPDRLLRLRPDRPRPGAAPGAPRALADGEAPPGAGGATLVPVASWSGRRSEAEVATPAGPVRATLRLGRLRGVVAEAPACRLRLEGRPAAVLELAAALAGPLNARPAASSLAEEARALALGVPARPPARGVPDLSGAAAVGEALERAIGHLGAALLGLAPGARPAAGPEVVHAMRVAARRLRSVLRAFRPVVDGPGLRALDAALRDLARALGAARDWDVFRDGVAAELSTALGAEPRFAALLREAEARRLAAYAALRGALDGPDGARLGALLLSAAHGLPWRAEAADPSAPATPLADHAARLLTRRRRRLRRDGAAIAGMPPDALHALRLSGKRLRYAAELFAPLWPGKASRRFARRLAAVQEALGRLNDAAVARGLARALAATPPGAPRRRAPGGAAAPGDDASRAWAAGLVEGWALGRARGARREALKAWKAFDRAEPFWDAA